MLNNVQGSAASTALEAILVKTHGGLKRVMDLYPPAHTPSHDLTPAVMDTGVAIQTVLHARQSNQFSPTIATEPDSSGDPQIEWDVDCQAVASVAARERGIHLVGEEDQFRAIPQDAPVPGVRQRGMAIRDAIAANKTVAVIDVLDGSHIAAGMNQPGGYCCAGFVVSPTSRAAGVILGTGDLVIADAAGVSHRQTTNPLHDDTWVELDGAAICARRYQFPTWLFPGYKRRRLAQLHQVSDVTHNSNLFPSDDPFAAPPYIFGSIAGNSGVTSSMILAPLGAVAAYQPESWAWDQTVGILCAQLGMVVREVPTGRRLSVENLYERFLADLVAGRKSTAIVIGKTLNASEAILRAVTHTEWDV